MLGFQLKIHTESRSRPQLPKPFRTSAIASLKSEGAYFLKLLYASNISLVRLNDPSLKDLIISPTSGSPGVANTLHRYEECISDKDFYFFFGLNQHKIKIQAVTEIKHKLQPTSLTKRLTSTSSP